MGFIDSCVYEYQSLNNWEIYFKSLGFKRLDPNLWDALCEKNFVKRAYILSSDWCPVIFLFYISCEKEIGVIKAVSDTGDGWHHSSRFFLGGKFNPDIRPIHRLIDYTSSHLNIDKSPDSLELFLDYLKKVYLSDKTILSRWRSYLIREGFKELTEGKTFSRYITTKVSIKVLFHLQQGFINFNIGTELSPESDSLIVKINETSGTEFPQEVKNMIYRVLVSL